MKCTYHPDVETNLRCGKCGKPICPKDMVQTPVGLRCRECARLYKLPTYQLSTKYYVRAIAAGAGTALLLGFLWGIVIRYLPFFYFNMLLAPLVGYLIAEVVGLAVNRKRGIILAIIVAVMTVASYLVGLVSPWGFGFHPLDLVALALGIFIAVSRMR